MSEHHAPHRREIRRREAPNLFEKAEIVFVIALVGFVLYALFMNMAAFRVGTEVTWKWSPLRMVFVIIGSIIGGLALISLILSILHFTNIINKKMKSSPYPPLLLITLNTGIVIAIVLIMIDKLEIKL